MVGFGHGLERREVARMDICCYRLVQRSIVMGVLVHGEGRLVVV